MFIYNITWITEPNTETALIDYLKSTFVPNVIADGYMHSPALHRIEQEASGDEGISIALHFLTEERSLIENYWKNNGNNHTQALLKEFGGKVMGFATVMKAIEL